MKLDNRKEAIGSYDSAGEWTCVWNLPMAEAAVGWEEERVIGKELQSVLR